LYVFLSIETPDVAMLAGFEGGALFFAVGAAAGPSVLSCSACGGGGGGERCPCGSSAAFGCGSGAAAIFVGVVDFAAAALAFSFAGGAPNAVWSGTDVTSSFLTPSGTALRIKRHFKRPCDAIWMALGLGRLAQCRLPTMHLSKKSYGYGTY
jgi:hypothetical protein